MMGNENANQMNFFSEMSEYQITAREFFSTVLLDSLYRNFGFNDILISYFDTHGNFLSWTNRSGALLDYEGHPYRRFMENDVVRYRIYIEAVRDHLTYFNVEPRLYKATDVIGEKDYENSPYVRFLEENFQKHYSVTLAFGINAYIQAAFFKSREDGDFTHVMSYNKTAQQYLADILGEAMVEHIDSSTPCSWLPFLLGGEEDAQAEDRVQTRVIKNYIFKIYTYDQTYSNGIIDRYHWITISKKKEQSASAAPAPKSISASGESLLTHAEQRVAELMCQGLTYKAIADELVVSYHTVKKHVQNIYSKCGINSRYELYKWMEDQAQE